MIQASSPRPKRAIGVRLHARSARRSLSADVADGCPIRACCEGASGMARALRCRRGRHGTLSRASPRMSSPSSSLWTTGATAVLQQSKRRPPFQAVGSLGADASAVRAAHVHRRWAAAVATTQTATTGLYTAQDGKPLAHAVATGRVSAHGALDTQGVFGGRVARLWADPTTGATFTSSQIGGLFRRAGGS